MGTDINTFHEPTFAERYGLEHLVFREGEGAADRKGKLANILSAMAHRDSVDGLDGSPLSKLSAQIQAPGESPTTDLAVSACWVLPESSPIWEVVLKFRGNSAFMYCIERENPWPFTAVAAFNFGEAFDPGRNIFSHSEKVVTDALNGMAKAVGYRYSCFAHIRGNRWLKIQEGGDISCGWVGDTKWFEDFDHWQSNFEPCFNSLPNL